MNLNQTIFYPQGGGQPADRGIIFNKEFEFTVKDVRINKHSEVLHFGQMNKGGFKKGYEVNIY